MFEYFFNLDKFYGDSQKKPDSISKGLWYRCEQENGRYVLIVDIAGIEQQDLSVQFVEQNWAGYVVIEGETKTDYGTYSIHQRFKMPTSHLSQDSSFEIKNGILYVTIIPENNTTTFNIKNKKSE